MGQRYADRSVQSVVIAAPDSVSAVGSSSPLFRLLSSRSLPVGQDTLGRFWAHCPRQYRRAVRAIPYGLRYRVWSDSASSFERVQVCRYRARRCRGSLDLPCLAATGRGRNRNLEGVPPLVIAFTCSAMQPSPGRRARHAVVPTCAGRRWRIRPSRLRAERTARPQGKMQGNPWGPRRGTP